MTVRTVSTLSPPTELLTLHKYLPESSTLASLMIRVPLTCLTRSSSLTGCLAVLPSTYLYHLNKNKKKTEIRLRYTVKLVFRNTESQRIMSKVHLLPLFFLFCVFFVIFLFCVFVIFGLIASARKVVGTFPPLKTLGNTCRRGLGKQLHRR